jgi:TIR domain-containing protein
MAGKRYRAFISYSQKDKAVGRRMQRWLETYRVPKGVVADLDRRRRLGRFFRDDDEMPASSDLAATLRGAIEDAENLIVIFSPNAARSVWVNAEILHFRRAGRGDRIFAVVADGIPNSGDPGAAGAGRIPLRERTSLTALRI